jgi:hypothetical protein
MHTEYIILCLNGVLVRAVAHSATEASKAKNRKITAKYINDADRYGSVTSICIAASRDSYIASFANKEEAAARWDAMDEVVWTKK